MDSLQYYDMFWFSMGQSKSFKPCYKWIAFNTTGHFVFCAKPTKGFKPCYKWIAFNTQK